MKKLKLGRESLYRLTPEGVRAVQGGETYSCGATCWCSGVCTEGCGNTVTLSRTCTASGITCIEY